MINIVDLIKQEKTEYFFEAIDGTNSQNQDANYYIT
jgi:hypothetical protein